MTHFYIGHYSVLDNSVQWLSRAQLCDPMDCSTPYFPVHHELQSLLKLMSVELVMPSIISSSVVLFSTHLQSSRTSGSFTMSQFFPSGGQSIGVSATASLLPKNIQDCFPLGWTGWISLQPKGLSRVFSNTTVQKHEFFRCSEFFYSPTLTSIHDCWKNHSFD